jgi:gamma-glutamyl:cysteine ligase YbdK (ATP-grasp superfamily)
MDLQLLYWAGGICLVGLTVYNFLVGLGRVSGSTEQQLRHAAENESTWKTKFDALDAKIVHHELRTNERIEKMLERLNEALLTMAREHPTKSDLQNVKMEILERIDSQYGTPARTR